MLRRLPSQWHQRLQLNPKRHLALWWPCAAMIVQAKNAPKPRPQAVAAMASPAASLATSQVLVVMANQVAMVVVTAAVKALLRVAHVWATRLSVRNVMLWNLRKMPCDVWLPKRTAKC